MVLIKILFLFQGTDLILLVFKSVYVIYKSISVVYGIINFLKDIYLIFYLNEESVFTYV